LENNIEMDPKVIEWMVEKIYVGQGRTSAGLLWAQ